MSGDYSRKTFDANKNFTAVLKQQGRVELDSDWNENVEIGERRWRTETIDIIGPAVVPTETMDGFRVGLIGGNLLIHPGRMYVDGLLAENHGREPSLFDPVLQEKRGTEPIPYDNQPYFPHADTIAPLPTGGPHFVYLDVWQREVTHLQDPGLIEPAVGVDTTTRVQTVWQVKALELEGVDDLDCHDEPEAWNELIAPSAGRLSTAVNPVAAEPDPCLLPPGGGYRGLENRLYRVEIHEGGGLGTARFKWARHNGSIETAVTAIDGAQLTAAQAEWDAVRRFEIGSWVEITDDVREFAGRPGEIRQIEDVDYATNRITLSDALPAGEFPTSGSENITDPERHTRIRRWDQEPEEPTDGLLTVTSTTLEIELGIQVTFSIDPDRPDGEFKVGDYWVFSARTAEASVEPLDEAPPRGIHHHYAKLAVVTFPGTVFDCRIHWPPQIASEGCCTVTVGDGTHSHGDYRSIEEAITGLPGTGGKVYVLPGDYAENVRIVGRTNITLAGCGQRSSVSSLPPGDDVGAANPVIYIANSANIRIESLAIEAHATGAGIFVEEIAPDPDGGPAFPAERLLLSGLELRAAARSAIEVHAASHLVIHGCRVTVEDVRSDWPGVFVVARDSLIANNEITVAPGQGGTAVSAVDDGGRGGLQLGGTCERVEVVDNRIRGGVGNGITLGSLEQVEQAAGSIVIDPFIAWPARREEPCDPCAPVSPRIPPWFTAGENNGNDEPPRYRSAGPLYDITIDSNRIEGMGLNGIGVAGFFDLDAVDEFITVEGLSIRNNHIHGCLNRPLAPIDPAMVDSMGYGGIALGDVENLVIHHNHIVDNGPSHLEPICGIFVLHGEGIDITDNQIVNNGAKSGSDVNDAKSGRRGGINIVLAVAPTVLTPIGARLGAAAPLSAIASRLFPRQNGVPAAKIHDNVVSQPLGRVLSLTALGPVSVVNNQLTSRNAMPFTRPPDPSSIAATVMIVNLGVSNELYGQVNNFSGVVAGSPGVAFAAPDVSGDAMVTSRPGLDDLRIGQYLANGNVLFTGNQCVLDLLETGFSFARSSIAILSLDDVAFHGNQCDCNLLEDFVSVQASLYGISVRVSDNRFKEGINSAAYSAWTVGMMNATTNNQSTHCLLVTSILPNAKVEAGNRVLLESLNQGYCSRSRDALGRTNFSLRANL